MPPLTGIWLYTGGLVCPVCKTKLDPSVSKSHTTNGYEVFVSCHGSSASTRIEAEELVENRWRDRVRDWVRNLFIHDRNPDVLELIQQNARATESARATEAR